MALAVPSFGAWDLPIYGELGELAIFDNMVQCHACGAWYRNVGNHSWWTHGLRAAEYRVVFGLRASTGLAGPVLLSATRTLHARGDTAAPAASKNWLGESSPALEGADAGSAVSRGLPAQDGCSARRSLDAVVLDLRAAV